MEAFFNKIGYKGEGLKTAKELKQKRSVKTPPAHSNTKSESDLIDWYKKMPKKFLLKTHNPNYENHKISVPFRMLIIGGSGAGKTQTLLNLIHIMNGTFQNIIIVTKNKHEPLYEFLEDKMKDGLLIVEGIDKMPDLDKMDKEEQTLIVMDDLVLERNQKSIEEAFIRGRKLNCSMVYISQSYYRVPRIIRQNLNYLIIKRLNELGDLFRIMREYSLGVKEKLKALYERAVSNNKQDFLLVDLDADPKERFRFNFNEIVELS